MPSYNTSSYIQKSICSVLKQSYPYWELIIVDDYSSDNTDDVIIPFLKDSRIRYLKNPKNYGAAISRNRALREAKGKWISFLDSDDEWLPEKLEKQVKFMQEKGYHFSYTNYVEIDSNENDIQAIVTGPRKITRTGFYNYCWPGCLTVMYDADSIGLIQILDIKKNNDYALWLKICQKADCYLLNEVLARYRRRRKGSISTNSIVSLIYWHYKLHRDSEKENIVIAMINTGRNLIFGLYKKIYYVKKIKA